MMTFLARMKVKDGMEAEFIRLAQALTSKVLTHESGTVAYEFFKLRDVPLGYAVFEQFMSEADEEAHRNTAYFGTLAPQLLACLDGSYVREYLDSID